MKALLRNPNGAIGLVLLTVVVAASVVGWIGTPHDPTAFDTPNRFLPPSATHPFGTDQFGRDILSRILAGGHQTLLIGLLSVALALVVGGLIGAVAGFRRGGVDLAAVTAMDILLAFPAVLLAMGIAAVLGASSRNVVIAVGIANIPAFARVARASVLSVMVRPYVRAAVALGSGNFRIFFRHVVPNIAGPMIVLTMLTTATAILVGSTLSFLGLGAAPPSPEWGVILSDARAYARLGWWLTIVPGASIAIAVLGLNLLGDGLRDVLDPTSKATRP